MNNVLATPPHAKASPRRAARSLAVMGISGLTGGAFGYAAVSLLIQSDLLPKRADLPMTTFDWIAMALVLTPAIGLGLFLVILVHELGHLLGGRLVGWKPLFLFVGPLKVAFGPGGAAVSFNRVASTWGGLAACSPPAGQPLRAPFACVVAGGPLASFALAAALGIAAAVGSGPVAGGAAMLAFLSALIGLATLLPLRSGGFTTDGGQLLSLWRNDASVHDRLMLATLMALSLGGVRPRDWDTGLLAQAATARSEPMLQTVGLLFNVLAAMDRAGGQANSPTASPTACPTESQIEGQGATRDAVERYARSLHDGGFAAYPAAFRSSLLLPVVVYLGHTLGDAAAARAWLSAAQGGMVEAWQRLHAEASVAWAEGRHDDALTRAQAALAQLPKAQDPGAAVAGRDALATLLLQASQASQASKVATTAADHSFQLTPTASVRS